MKTIKFILNDDGSIASSSIGFQINQYSYNDTLINVYVPTEILNTETDTETYSYGNNIVMAMYYTLANASQKLGNPYYFTFVKNNVVIEGKTYTLFERKMPKEFTLYYGTQNYAVNVILTRTNISVHPTITEIVGNITSANFELTINQSLNMADNPIEVDTDLSTLIANVNSLLANILLKQDKQDGLIQVAIANGSLINTDVVVDALNYLNQRVKDNFDTNGSQQSDITGLDTRVTDLENQAITGFRYIGSITSNVAPNSTDLNNYATSQGITLQNGDVAIWLQQVSGGTDKTYRCIWDYPNNWTWYEIPPIELASNDNAGLVHGNYGNDTTSKVLASIVGGKITDVYYKTSANNYISIADSINGITTNIANIISGSQVVGKSQYATYDDTEENKLVKKTIDEKFLTKTEGATKQYVHNYALPRQFNDVYTLQLAVNGNVNKNDFDNDEVGTQTTKITALSLGDNTFLNAYLYPSDYEYQLSKKNSFKLNAYISFTNAITDVGLTLNIYWEKEDETPVLIASTTIDRADYNTNIHKIVFADYFNQLDDVGIHIGGEDVGRFNFEFVCNTSSSATNDITITSTTGYETTLSYSTDSYTLVTSQSGIILHEKEMTLDTSNGNVLIAELGSIVLTDQTQHQFILTLPSGMSWSDIPENCYFDIQINGVSVDYSINKKFINDNYIGFMSPFYNNFNFNFIATSLDDGNGGFYFDIVSEDNMSLYITRDNDVQYDVVEDKYYVSNEYFEMLNNNVCVVNFNALGITNDYPQTTLLRINDYDDTNKMYSFDYDVYDDNTQQITHYNIKLILDTNNSKWYFACGKDGIYTQTSINSLLNAKADLTNAYQVITASKIKVNSIKDQNDNNIVPTLADDNTFTGENTFNGNVNITNQHDLSVDGATYTNDLYVGNNDIFDILDNQFLTDAEMETLISEVFD